MHTRTLIFLLAFLMWLPITTSAATVSLHPTPVSVGVGDVVSISVLLDSTTATNAFSGTLIYPAATLEPTDIVDGGSIISLWVTRPVVPTTGEAIAFAGITPGGFTGRGAVLFSVLFRAKKDGTAMLSLKDVEVLRNDGAGGREPVHLKPLTLSILPLPLGGYAEPVDQTPPEPFTAYRSNDPQLQGGKEYLVFTTVDKSSGIDHYAVAESRVPSSLFWLFPLVWSATTSPYVLMHQNLTSTVYINAIDRAGNERVSVFPPRHLFTTYEKIVALGILIVLALLSQTWWRRRFGKNS